MTIKELWLKLKELYPEALVLIRIGDFYEAFAGDAKEVAETCNLYLSSRRGGSWTIPMAGFPYHKADQYIRELVDAGYWVLLADRDGTIREGQWAD